MAKQKVVIAINQDDITKLEDMLTNNSHLIYNFTTIGGTDVEVVFVPEATDD